MVMGVRGWPEDLQLDVVGVAENDYPIGGAVRFFDTAVSNA
jgi:hypothetical protein